MGPFTYVVNNYLEPICVPLAERGFFPDAVIRFGIRRLLGTTLERIRAGGSIEAQQEQLNALIADLKTRGIAEQTEKANEQHYEVPAKLFQIMLGPHLKYSCGYWGERNELEYTAPEDIAKSEEMMLDLVCKRAELDTLTAGQTVLDLGCGWGSAALYIAEKFPHLKVTCVSNSNSQREFIRSKAKERGLKNLEPMTSDINVLEYPANTFDRVVSNEMFEHMKNYEKLLQNISTWLKPEGKLFVHIFTHREFPYHFEKGWMAENFFSGGTMPSKDLLLFFNKHLKCEQQWAVNGKHYSKTLDAWNVRLDKNDKEVKELFVQTYGKGTENKWLFNWRLFNMACSELFQYNDGNEWFISHYRFVKA